MSQTDQALRVRPALRPRLECLASALLMLAIAAACMVLALTRGRMILDPASGLELGGLEPFKHLLVGLIWAQAAVAVLLALWLLWAMSDASRRLQVVIADGVLEWRPMIGRRVRIDLATLRRVDDEPGGRLTGPHLALHWGRRRKPLRLLRKWYMPLDVKRLRLALRSRLEAQGEAAEA